MQTQYQAGFPNPSVLVKFTDATTGAPRTDLNYATVGLTLFWTGLGGNKTTFAPAELVAGNSAWVSGGFVHVGEGVYRVDPPTASAITTRAVLVGGTLSGTDGHEGIMNIVAYNPRDPKLGMANGDFGDLVRVVELASIATSLSNLIATVKDFLEADRYIDVSNPEHWALVLIKKGTGALGSEDAVELLRQPLYAVNGAPLNSVSTPRGRAVSVVEEEDDDA